MLRNTTFGLILITTFLIANPLYAQISFSIEYGRTIYPADKFYDYRYVETDSGTLIIPLMTSNKNLQHAKPFSPRYYSFVYYPITLSLNVWREQEQFAYGMSIALASRMASPLIKYELIDPIFPVNYRYFAIYLTPVVIYKLSQSRIKAQFGMGITARLGSVGSTPVGGHYFDIKWNGSWKYGNGVSLNAIGLSWFSRIMLKVSKDKNIFIPLTTHIKTFLFGYGSHLYPLQISITLGVARLPN